MTTPILLLLPADPARSAAAAAAAQAEPAQYTGWEAFLDDRCGGQLDIAREALIELKAMSQHDTGAVLAQWNRLTTAVANASAVSSLLSQVHPDLGVRDVAEAHERAALKFSSELTLDRALFEVFPALGDTSRAGADAGGLSPDEERLLHFTRRDFRRAGVDRDEATRARLQQLSERDTVLSQEFSRTVRDDVRTIRVTPERLAGMPADFVASHLPDADGLVAISTDYPDSVPLRTFAHDASARRELTVAFLDRGWPDNDARLRELLAVRHERATVLGYASWADYDAEVKMVGTGAAIEQFIEQIAGAAATAAAADHARLVQRLQVDRPDATQIDAADVAYYTEQVRREAFDVDATQVRTYFDFAKVRAGLLDVTGLLFGLRYEPAIDAPAWHADVAVYDVYRDDSCDDVANERRAGERLGRIYLDLHPRAGKYKHAAQFDLVPGVAGGQLPEGVLVCNFSAGLMEHDDVVTLFHEFGHLMHHILGGHQQWQRFSGVATEWDFVEAPSQMLEEWAWNADILRRFAADASGAPIPVDLVARMRAADTFGEGLWARTQNFYSALSYVVHVAPVRDLTALMRELQSQYSWVAYLPETHFHASFEHLVGYGSGYYTYLWSLVIAKDLFSAFDSDDLLAPGPAARYRDMVLAAGGTQDAADLVRGFLGRPYRFQAFQAWLDTGSDRSTDTASDQRETRIS